jgi:hypothetical protein
MVSWVLGTVPESRCKSDCQESGLGFGEARGKVEGFGRGIRSVHELGAAGAELEVCSSIAGAQLCDRQHGTAWDEGPRHPVSPCRRARSADNTFIWPVEVMRMIRPFLGPFPRWVTLGVARLGLSRHKTKEGMKEQKDVSEWWCS